MKSFSLSEKAVLLKFEKGSFFVYNDLKYTVTNSGKPTSSTGEPKTDIYVEAKSDSGDIVEFKISYKQPNADFLENKINAIRAEQILGQGWKQVIISSVSNLESKFKNRKLVFKTKGSRTEKGSITLGWKFEILDKPGGELSAKIDLTLEQKLDIFSGTNLGEDKKDARVNGVKILNSGISNFVLYGKDYDDLQSIVDSLIPIKEYCKDADLYFACKALNYRTFRKKWDGNRPLCVYVDWFVIADRLDHKIIFNAPFAEGNKVAKNLIKSMVSLAISNTDDIIESNMVDWRAVKDDEE